MLVATLNCVRNTLDESLSKEAMGLKDVSSGIPGRMMANSMAFDNVAVSILDQMEVHPLGLSSSHWSDNRWCSFLMEKKHFLIPCLHRREGQMLLKLLFIHSNDIQGSVISV